MNKALGKRLAALVNDAGFSGMEGRERFRNLLESKHGINPSQSTLYSWLSGERSPKVASLRAILDTLGVHGEDRNEIVRLALPDECALLLAENRQPDDAPVHE